MTSALRLMWVQVSFFKLIDEEGKIVSEINMTGRNKTWRVLWDRRGSNIIYQTNQGKFVSEIKNDE